MCTGVRRRPDPGARAGVAGPAVGSPVNLGRSTVEVEEESCRTFASLPYRFAILIGQRQTPRRGAGLLAADPAAAAKDKYEAHVV